MKHQILKSVACIALMTMMASVARAELQASDGIDGYRKAIDGVFNPGQIAGDLVKKQKDNLTGKINEMSKEFDDGVKSVTDIADKISAKSIVDLGGDVMGRAGDGAKSFKVLDGFDFTNAGTMGDKWLNHFYGSGVDKNYDKYLSGNLAQQLGATGDSSPFEEYYDNAHETYLRGTAAKILYDETGIDNGDLWMWSYIPSVGVGEGILRAYEGETVDSVNTALRAGQSIEDAALSMQDFGKMKKDMNFDTDVGDIAKELTDNATEEVQRMFSTEAMRFMNGEAFEDMKANGDAIPMIGAGIPTMDVLNMLVGMYNLDSVYSTVDENAAGGPGGAGQITQTPGVQVADYKSCVTSGKTAKECCTQVAGGIEGGSAVAKGAVSYQQCCTAMTGKADCTPLPLQQAKDCLEEKEDPQQWTLCDIQCKNTDFGDLIHKKMEDGKTTLDKELIDNLLEECGVGESKWVPAKTVLTSAELAAVVPETIKPGLADR